MMSAAESQKLKEIKQLVLDGRRDLVSKDERQWMLDLLKREAITVRPEVKTLAAKEGYNVDGVLTA